MRLWENNRGLVIGVVAALAVWFGFRAFVTGKISAETAELRNEISEGQMSLGKHTRPNAVDIDEAEDGLRKEATALKLARADLDSLQFRTESRFDPAADRGQPRLYFEQELDAVREVAREGSVEYREAAAPLGFKGDFVGKAEVSDLLKRLAMANHLRRCCEKAGVEAVLGVSHLDIAVHGGEQASVYISEYPMAVSILAHERSLISLLYNLQTKDRCTPVKKLSITVTDSGSGSFRADIELSALFVERKKLPKGEAEGEKDPYGKPIKKGGRRY